MTNEDKIYFSDLLSYKIIIAKKNKRIVDSNIGSGIIFKEKCLK